MDNYEIKTFTDEEVSIEIAVDTNKKTIWMTKKSMTIPWSDLALASRCLFQSGHLIHSDSGNQ